MTQIQPFSGMKTLSTYSEKLDFSNKAAYLSNEGQNYFKLNLYLQTIIYSFKYSIVYC